MALSVNRFTTDYDVQNNLNYRSGESFSSGNQDQYGSFGGNNRPRVRGSPYLQWLMRNQLIPLSKTNSFKYSSFFLIAALTGNVITNQLNLKKFDPSKDKEIGTLKIQQQKAINPLQTEVGIEKQKTKEKEDLLKTTKEDFQLKYRPNEEANRKKELESIQLNLKKLIEQSESVTAESKKLLIQMEEQQLDGDFSKFPNGSKENPSEEFQLVSEQLQDLNEQIKRMEMMITEIKRQLNKEDEDIRLLEAQHLRILEQVEQPTTAIECSELQLISLQQQEKTIKLENKKLTVRINVLRETLKNKQLQLEKNQQQEYQQKPSNPIENQSENIDQQNNNLDVLKVETQPPQSDKLNIIADDLEKLTKKKENLENLKKIRKERMLHQEQFKEIDKDLNELEKDIIQSNNQDYKNTIRCIFNKIQSKPKESCTKLELAVHQNELPDEFKQQSELDLEHFLKTQKGVNRTIEILQKRIRHKPKITEEIQLQPDYIEGLYPALFQTLQEKGKIAQQLKPSSFFLKCLLEQQTKIQEEQRKIHGISYQILQLKDFYDEEIRISGEKNKFNRLLKQTIDDHGNFLLEMQNILNVITGFVSNQYVKGIDEFNIKKTTDAVMKISKNFQTLLRNLHYIEGVMEEKKQMKSHLKDLGFDLVQKCFDSLRDSFYYTMGEIGEQSHQFKQEFYECLWITILKNDKKSDKKISFDGMFDEALSLLVENSEEIKKMEKNIQGYQNRIIQRENSIKNREEQPISGDEEKIKQNKWDIKYFNDQITDNRNKMEEEKEKMDKLKTLYQNFIKKLQSKKKELINILQSNSDLHSFLNKLKKYNIHSGTVKDNEITIIIDCDKSNKNKIMFMFKIANNDLRKQNFHALQLFFKRYDFGRYENPDDFLDCTESFFYDDKNLPSKKSLSNLNDILNAIIE
jgi:hypothetical protein